MAKDKFGRIHSGAYRHVVREKNAKATVEMKKARNRKTWFQFFFGWLIKDNTLDNK